MTIKEDALELLKYLYNDKVDGKQSSLDRALDTTKMLPIRLTNAYEYLKEGGFINVQAETMGVTEKGLPNVIGLKISKLGIDVFDDKDLFRQEFGTKFQFTIQNGKVNIVDNRKEGEGHNISSPELSGVSHTNVGEVNYGPKITRQDGSSVTYNVSPENVNVLERASIWVTNNYGERKPKIVGWISLVSGIVSIIESLNLPPSILKWWPTLPEQYTSPILVIGIILTIIGTYLLKVVRYRSESTCEKCGNHYSLSEIGEGEREEVKTHEGLRIMTKRTYKCKKCGYVCTKKNYEVMGS